MSRYKPKDIRIQVGTKLAVTKSYHDMMTRLEEPCPPVNTMLIVTDVFDDEIWWQREFPDHSTTNNTGKASKYHAERMYFHSKTVKREKTAAHKEFKKSMREQILDMMIQEYADQNGIEWPPNG